MSGNDGAYRQASAVTPSPMFAAMPAQADRSIVGLVYPITTSSQPEPTGERNEAMVLAIEESIEKTRPRIGTLEETCGLTRTPDNLEWFNA